MAPNFLGLADVFRIHVDQIERYGGHAGVREVGLLNSALDMPGASFGGEWLHRDIYEMAAAYAFHISQNHPFLDGDKRTALASALVFLEINGISLVDPDGILYEAMMKVATGVMNKQRLAEVFKSLPHERN